MALTDMRKILCVIILFVLTGTLYAQQTDTIRTKKLEAVTIAGDKLFSIDRLPKVKGAYLWAGRKNEVINVLGIPDINTLFRIYTNLMVRFNFNNVTDEQYFTKRPAFYPGPGVWSSDGRSVNFSVAFKI
jgi:hypothetical protein